MTNPIAHFIHLTLCILVRTMSDNRNEKVANVIIKHKLNAQNGVVCERSSIADVLCLIAKQVELRGWVFSTLIDVASLRCSLAYLDA